MALSSPLLAGVSTVFSQVPEASDRGTFGMGYNAQKLVRKLPLEIKLTANSRRLLDYLAFCANEEDAEKTGVYSCPHPSPAGRP